MKLSHRQLHQKHFNYFICLLDRGGSQYPTVFISFADAKGDKDIVTKHIKSYFRSLYNDYDFIFKNLTRLETYDYETIIHGLTNEKIELKHISDSLAFLMRILEKYYNKKVMVFIDEYDTPFIEAHLGGFYEDVNVNINFTKNVSLSFTSFDCFAHLPLSLISCLLFDRTFL